MCGQMRGNEPHAVRIYQHAQGRRTIAAFDGPRANLSGEVNPVELSFKPLLTCQMPRRYDIQKDPDELWTVYDKFTGWPAELDGLVLTGLSERAAKKFVGTLNLRDHIDRMARGVSVKNAR